MKTILQYAIIALLILAIAHPGRAQTMSPEAMVGQILAAHIGPNGLPTDFVLQGQVTSGSNTYSLRMTVKGKNQIRYEQTQGTRTSLSIFNAGTAWTGSVGSLKPVMQHAAIRRPIEIPFLDILIDVGAPRWTVRYLGTETLGVLTVL